MADLWWIASYPRSGNTWLRFLVVNCLADEDFHWSKAMNAFAFELYYYQKKMREDGWSEADVFQTIHRVIGGQPTAGAIGQRVFFKTHDLWSAGHPFAAHTRGAVLLVRDPRDVLLSGLNYARLTRGYDGDDARYAREFIAHGGDPAWIKAGYGTWFGHSQSWTGQGEFPVHVVRYEALKTDPVPTLLGVCAFLGFGVTEADAARAVERTDMATMRSVEDKARRDGIFKGLKEGYNFFHKGRSGQSLDAIEPGLDALFERSLAPALAETGYARAPHADAAR